MRSERRAAPRASVQVLFNKYIDGVPFAAEALEVSETGMLVRRVHEPERPRATYAVEIEAGEGPPRWLCVASVWRWGDFEALAFVGHGDEDRRRLGELARAS